MDIMSDSPIDDLHRTVERILNDDYVERHLAEARRKLDHAAELLRPLLPPEQSPAQRRR